MRWGTNPPDRTAVISWTIVITLLVLGYLTGVVTVQDFLFVRPS